MKINKLQIGQTIYDVRKSTGLHKFHGQHEWWSIVIEDIDLENKQALCSRNGNPPKWKSEKEISKYRYSKPGGLRK